MYLLKLNKNCLESSRKFFINCRAQNLFGMFWKMGKIENSITQVTKAKFEENRYFPFTLGRNNWEITHSAEKQENWKFCYIVIMLNKILPVLNRRPNSLIYSHQILMMLLIGSKGRFYIWKKKRRFLVRKEMEGLH